MNRLITAITKFDPYRGWAVTLLSLIWLSGGQLVFSALFILQPDSGHMISMSDTVLGAFPQLSSLDLALGSTLLFVGWLFGSSVLSILSDNSGRRVAFIVGCSVTLAGMLTQIFALNYVMFLVGRALVGFGVGGCGVVSYTLGMEIMLSSEFESSKIESEEEAIGNTSFDSDQVVADEVPDYADEAALLSQRSLPKRSERDSDHALFIAVEDYSPSTVQQADPVDTRPKLLAKQTDTTIGATLYQLMWGLGTAILSLIAYYVSYWRYLLTIISCMYLCLCLIVIWFVVESPKWLRLNGKSLEYVRNAEIIELFNQKRSWSLLDKSAVMSPIDKPVQIVDQVGTGPQNHIKTAFGPLIPLLKQPHFFKTIILGYIWFSNAFVYYGLYLSANKLPGNVYIVTAGLAMISWPGQLSSIIMTRRFGDKITFACSMICCSIIVILISFLSAYPEFEGKSGVIVGLSLLGQFFVSISFSLCYLITSKLYPTAIRNTGMGICVMLARVGAMLCPLVALIGKDNNSSNQDFSPVGMLILGCTIFLSGPLTLLLYRMKSSENSQDTE